MSFQKPCSGVPGCWAIPINICNWPHSSRPNDVPLRCLMGCTRARKHQPTKPPIPRSPNAKCSTLRLSAGSRGEKGDIWQGLGLGITSPLIPRSSSGQHSCRGWLRRGPWVSDWCSCFSSSTKRFRSTKGTAGLKLTSALDETARWFCSSHPGAVDGTFGHPNYLQDSIPFFVTAGGFRWVLEG